MRPPDGRPQLRRPLSHRNEEIADGGETVIIPARVPLIPADTMGEELGMIPPEERLLQTRAALWIPMQGHHIRQVLCTEPHRPPVPVNEAHGVRVDITGKQKIPHMSIAMHEGQIVVDEQALPEY